MSDESSKATATTLIQDAEDVVFAASMDGMEDAEIVCFEHLLGGAA